MKIAILSDIHEGINRKKTNIDIMALLNNWLDSNKLDVFIISGDMTAGPEKSLNLLNQLQNSNPQTKILFVHGNHDVYYGDSTQAYEILLKFPGNLGNGPIELDDNWVIIGDGGWYDYSFGLNEYSAEQFSLGTFGNFTWPDKTYANWLMDDQKLTDHYVEKMERWLQKYEGKNIIMVTHIVPFSHFVERKGDPSWDFFNAMMGSSRFGELAEKYNVKKYIFGHIHTRYHEQYKGIEMICNPLGYYPYEWNYNSPEKEIYSTMKVIDI